MNIIRRFFGLTIPQFIVLLPLAVVIVVAAVDAVVTFFWFAPVYGP